MPHSLCSLAQGLELHFNSIPTSQQFKDSVWEEKRWHSRWAVDTQDTKSDRRQLAKLSFVCAPSEERRRNGAVLQGRENTGCVCFAPRIWALIYKHRARERCPQDLCPTRPGGEKQRGIFNLSKAKRDFCRCWSGEQETKDPLLELVQETQGKATAQMWTGGSNVLLVQKIIFVSRKKEPPARVMVYSPGKGKEKSYSNRWVTTEGTSDGNTAKTGTA